MGLLFLLSVLFAASVHLKSLNADDTFVLTSSLYSNEIYVYKRDVTSFYQQPSILNWTEASTSIVLSIDIDTTNSTILLLDLERSCVYTRGIFASISSVKELHCGISKSVGSTIAYDWVSKNLYWSDGILQWISVQPLYTKDNQMYRILVQDVTDISALAVDPINRYIFWFDASPSGGRIERASLDGQQRKAILTNGILLVFDIVADVTSGKIFWVDFSRYSIESANYEGLQRQVLYKRKQFSLFALAVDEDVVCATLPSHKLWLCVGKRNGEIKYYQVDNQRMSYGIAIYNKVLQPQNKTNFCSLAICQHICVNDEYGAICLCKEGYTLNQDGSCSDTHGFFGKGLLVAFDKQICILDFRAVVHGSTNDFQCIQTGLQGVKYLQISLAKHVGFYYESTNKHIKSYNLESGETNNIQKTTEMVSGLSFDWRENMLYWCESNIQGIIGRVSVSYDYSEVFVYSQRSITDVAVDPHNRIVFWIEEKTKIVWSQMDDGKTINVFEESGTKSDLFYDVKLNRLFWTQDSRIFGINVFESEIKQYTLITQSSQLITYKSYFIWISGTQTLQTVPLTSDHSDIKTITLPDRGDITGIAVFDEDTQPMEKGACEVNNSGCDHVCLIVSNGRVCKCKFGFTLDSDSTSCRTGPLNQDSLLATDLTHARIYQIALQSGIVKSLDLPLVERPVTVRYDSVRKYLYWTEANRGQIIRANENGKDWEIIYSSVYGTHPERIAMDQNNGYLYFSTTDIESSNKGYIGAIDVTSLHSKTLFTGLGRVFGLSLYSPKGNLYFANNERNASYIYRAAMDGSFKAVLFRSLSPIFDLAIDHKIDRLYWSMTNELWSSDLSGLNSGMIVKVEKSIIECILPVNPYIYYSSHDSQSIIKFDIIRKQAISWMPSMPEIGLLASLDIVTKEAIPVIFTSTEPLISTSTPVKDSNIIPNIAGVCGAVLAVTGVVVVIIFRRRCIKSSDHVHTENICSTDSSRNQPPIALTETIQLPPSYAESENTKQLSSHTAMVQLYGTTSMTHSNAGNFYEELNITANEHPVPACHGDNAYIHPVNMGDYASLMPPRNPHPDFFSDEESKNI